MKNLVLVLSLVIGLIGCGGESKNGVGKYRGEMERYIDSVSDDYGSYEFVEMGVDSVYFSEFYEYLTDSSIGEDGHYNGSSYDLYKNSEKYYIECQNQSRYLDCDFEKDNFESWKKTYYDELSKLDRLKRGLEYDSCNQILYYINYKIRNKNNGLEKRSCVYYISPIKGVEDRKINEGYFINWIDLIRNN